MVVRQRAGVDVDREVERGVRPQRAADRDRDERRDFPWALGLILLTAAAVQVGTRAFGDPAGTFIGAIVMTAAALLLGRRPGLPPAYVVYLGAFYVLTPGSHGLRGLESWIGGDKIEGVTGVAEMAGLLIAIAVGMLVTAAAIGPARRGMVSGAGTGRHAPAPGSGAA